MKNATAMITRPCTHLKKCLQNQWAKITPETNAAFVAFQERIGTFQCVMYKIRIEFATSLKLG